MAESAATLPRDERWLVPGVGAIGLASLLSDLGHEVPTSLLPSFLSSTLGAPAAALGLIEGVADACAGVAQLAGGPLADDPARRRRTAVGGYVTTAVCSSAIGLAGAAWQVGVLRSLAWSARGLRSPARNALLAEIAPPGAYGRAYGFERALDNLGAIGGPLLAIGLLALVGIRTAIVVSVVPGLLAALAITVAMRHGRREQRAEAPLEIRLRPLLRGPLAGLLGGVAAFELANAAATVLILRATRLLEPHRAHASAVEVALGLYAAYNLAASVVSVPGGRLTDRRGAKGTLVLGSAALAAGYAGFAYAGSDVALLALFFLAAGVGIGFVEAAENAALAALAPPALRGSAFGLLAGVQAFANLAASAVWGLLYTLVSPTAAFDYLAAWAALAAVAFLLSAPRAVGGNRFVAVRPR